MAQFPQVALFGEITLYDIIVGISFDLSVGQKHIYSEHAMIGFLNLWDHFLFKKKYLFTTVVVFRTLTVGKIFFNE